MIRKFFRWFFGLPTINTGNRLGLSYNTQYLIPKQVMGITDDVYRYVAVSDPMWHHARFATHVRDAICTDLTLLVAGIKAPPEKKG